MFESGLVSRDGSGGARIFASTELVMSVLGSYADESSLLSSPSGYISSVSSTEMCDDVSVDIVYNDLESMNLILPYYGSVSGSSVGGISDRDMSGVSGGGAAGGAWDWGIEEVVSSPRASSYGVQIVNSIEPPESRQSGVSTEKRRQSK